MSGKLQNTRTESVDPDDAPELTAEFFENATPMIGGRKVTIEEYRQAVKNSASLKSPPLDDSKVAFVFRLDADVFAAFAATGDEWEARMNDALRDWLKTNVPR